MTVQLLELAAADYVRHDFHRGEGIWNETNCYVDVWVELLRSLGLDPVAGLAFTLNADFDGSQWSFVKYPAEDLRALYGVDVAELNVWRPLIDHVTEHLRRGNLLTIEVDSWFLPDTAGVSYQLGHVKTTIVPQQVDLAARHLGYFHNAGYYELSGDDFDGVFRLGEHDDAGLPPYVELVRLDRMDRERATLPAVEELVREHLARRAVGNPVTELGEALVATLPWLAEQGVETFHTYAFGTCRQLGATAELAAWLTDWLVDRGAPGLDGTAEHFRRVAEDARTTQLQLARAARGRSVDLSGLTRSMAQSWDAAIGILVSRYG